MGLLRLLVFPLWEKFFGQVLSLRLLVLVVLFAVMFFNLWCHVTEAQAQDMMDQLSHPLSHQGSIFHYSLVTLIGKTKKNSFRR